MPFSADRAPDPVGWTINNPNSLPDTGTLTLKYMVEKEQVARDYLNSHALVAKNKVSEYKHRVAKHPTTDSLLLTEQVD